MTSPAMVVHGNSMTVPLPTSPAWLAVEAQAAPRIRAIAKSWVVTDPTSLQNADETAKIMLSLRDRLEKERVSVTGPLLQAKRTVDGWFNPVIDILDEAIRDIKTTSANYILEERRKQQEQFQLAARAHEQAVAGAPGAHQQMALALQATTSAVVTPPQGTSIREEWRAEIFNASIVPCFYHCVDEARIQAVARSTPAHLEPAPIGGVRFIKVPIVSMRR